MSRHQPNIQTVESSEAQQRWSQLLNQVFQHGTRVVLEKDGSPVAAIISTEDLERLNRLEARQTERFAIVARMREAFADVSPEQLERDMVRVMEEVRSQSRHGQQDPESP